MPTIAEGFWIPHNLRSAILSPATEYDVLSLHQGRPADMEEEGAVTARWPRLSADRWSELVASLQNNRQHVPRGQVYWSRLQAALTSAARRLADPVDPLRRQALAVVPVYTGYSEAMIRAVLAALDLMSLEQMPKALSTEPLGCTTTSWQAMPGLPGRLRFYPHGLWPRIAWSSAALAQTRLFSEPCPPDLVVGYGAGNVPGTALLIVLLALATTLATDQPPPAIIVRNSRREPVFTPLIFDALADADPDLLATVAVLVWDHEDRHVQDMLLPQADLVIAAASDEVISQIGTQIAAAQNASAPRQRIRFHAHGHKVSFAAIGKDVLRRGLRDEAAGGPVLDIVTLLAALDSSFWDQQGCLSARLHFVESSDPSSYSARTYAERLTEQMRLLAAVLPRGDWPHLHVADLFDKYKLMERSGRVTVLSGYEDPFLVVVDERPLSEDSLRRLVNDCQGRVIVVRPVPDLLDVPRRFLRLLPAENLQSISVAVGRPGDGLSETFLAFASACADRGVTAIRTVGRAAFPQLAYSWDGFLPRDLVANRPPGHFTTIEFDRPYDEMIETFCLVGQRSLQG